MAYDNTNRGVLWKNDRKQGEKSPDYTGKLDVNGVEFYLSAWIKTGQKGKYMSLSIKPKDDGEQRAAPRAAAGVGRPAARQSPPNDFVDEDDIPF